MTNTSFAQQTDNSLPSCLPALRKRVAFTLAEVLITLGIIGIVAAMTLPTLIEKHNDRVTVEKVKQAYSLFSNAFEIAQVKYETANLWDAPQINPQELWYERVCENLKVIKDCGDSGAFWLCGNPSKKIYPYKNLYQTGDEYASIMASPNSSGVLNNGMMFGFHYFMESGDKWWSQYGRITVDINGHKGPNVIGKDLFQFVIADMTSKWEKSQPPKLYPLGFGSEEECLDSSKGGSSCTAWILMYNNVDYLHCREKLLKTGAHSCKEANN